MPTKIKEEDALKAIKDIKNDIKEIRKEKGIENKTRKVELKKAKHFKRANEIQSRQYEILSKYYDINENTGVICLNLHYDSAIELFDNVKYHSKSSFFSPEIMAYVSDSMEKFPDFYDVELNITIEDYDEYTPKEIIDSFHDNVEITHYRKASSFKNKWIIVALLLSAGVALLTVVGIGSHIQFWSKSKGYAVLQEVVDISGWVFIWQGVTVAFLSPIDNSINTRLIKRNLLRINLIDSNGKVIYKDKTRERLNNWVSENKFLKINKLVMLIISIIIMMLATYELVDDTYEFYEIIRIANLEIQSIAVILVLFVVTILTDILLLFQGFAGISIYSGKNRFVILTGVISFLIFVTEIAEISLAVSLGNTLDFGTISNALISLLFFISYIVYVIYFINRRRKIK